MNAMCVAVIFLIFVTGETGRLTLEGFSWLMMVVFPLLSNPRHRTFTSFFNPNHPANLSNSPIGYPAIISRLSDLQEKKHKTVTTHLIDLTGY